MFTVKKLIAAAVLVTISAAPALTTAQEIHEYDAARCIELSKLYTADGSTMSVAQMDDLKLCISDTREMLRNQKQSEKETKAIDKLYGLTDSSYK